MLQMVWERRRAAYNHASAIAQSPIKTAIKLLYYCAFAILYGAVGSLASLVMVNSSWTCNHIRFLWKIPAWRKTIQIVYPPCAVSDLQSLADARQQSSLKDDPSKKKNAIQTIVSIGQFRPEKDHVLQIEAMARLLENHPELKQVKMKLVGSCRNTQDEARLALLKGLVQELHLESHVEFEVNVPYSSIKACLQESAVGIHTMWNEHFGIGIVEMMAAGLLVVAHNSGGPRSDIVAPGKTGFLAATVDEYADAIYEALTLSPSEATRMRKAAQQSALRFSDEVFATSFREKLLDAKLL
jgi:alpha-1,2-mannosyltransferase